jgi:hypothetical protein
MMVQRTQPARLRRRRVPSCFGTQSVEVKELPCKLLGVMPANPVFPGALSLDGDGQHDSTEIPFFLRKAESTGAPLVIGNRMERPDEMPWIRRWLTGG